MNADVAEDREVVPCLLCKGTSTRSVEFLSLVELKSLWQELDVTFSENGLETLEGHSKLCLLECDACGFRFFNPILAGGEVFYRELTHANYFAPERPEFYRTLNFAKVRGLTKVLDIGCGSGAFLDLARQRGLATFGLELNSQAAANAERKGHIVFPHLLSQFGPLTLAGRFDLITMFQVLEHVPNPVEVMQQAAALLDVGGCISVSVPQSRALRAFSRWDPHDWPPHHVSRWRKKDLSTLARLSQLNLLKVEADPLTGHDIVQAWHLHERLTARIEGRPKSDRTLTPRLISFFYRKLGLKHFLPRLGHSIQGYFVRQRDPAQVSYAVTT